jgi:hypothetical protein
MAESEDKNYLDVARAVISEAQTPATIEALAAHAAALEKFRGTQTFDVVSIGTHINECLHLIKDAVFAVAGDTTESRKKATDLHYTYLPIAIAMPRSIARQYMRIAERSKEIDLDPSEATVRNLLSRSYPI